MNVCLENFVLVVMPTLSVMQHHRTISSMNTRFFTGDSDDAPASTYYMGGIKRLLLLPYSQDSQTHKNSFHYWKMNLGIKFITSVPTLYLCVPSTNFQGWAPAQPLCITEGSLEVKTSVTNDSQLFLLFSISLERSTWYIISSNINWEKHFPQSCWKTYSLGGLSSLFLLLKALSLMFVIYHSWWWTSWIFQNPV